VTMRAMSAASPPPRRSSRLRRPTIALVALVGALAFMTAGPVAHPAPANAGTAESMESLLVRWINSARAARGVPALSVGTKLTNLAGDRAATLARTTTLSHPSCLACVFRSRDISFRTCAEVIAMTTYPWGYDAAKSIFNAWRASPTHWSILMSRTFTRIGIGVAYRSSNRSTWAAGELAG
jgi:uncharacterized protein YkwD